MLLLLKCYNENMIKNVLKENIKYFMIILFLIIVFLLIINSSLYPSIVNFDSKVIHFFKTINVKSFTNVMRIFTNIGDWYIPILIIVCSFIFLRNKNYFYILGGSYLFAGIVSFVAKWIILRPRPVEALIKIPTSYSFPSGHTLTSIVFYLTLCYLIMKKVKNPVKPIILFSTILLISLIALSRMYLGVHFFSDVVGGIIFGIICEIAVITTIRNNFSEKI